MRIKGTVSKVLSGQGESKASREGTGKKYFRYVLRPLPYSSPPTRKWDDIAAKCAFS